MVRGLCPDRGGIALVDVLVASIILGVSLALLVSLAGRAAASLHRGDRLRTAAMLIDEQLNLVLARGPDDYDRRYPTEGQCDAPFDDFAYAIDLDDSGPGDPYVVRVTVSWIDAGRERSAMVETLMAPRLGEDPDPERQPEETITRDF